MAVDLKAELTRPLALILAVLALLGWLLFGLSSLSAASVQRTQRIQIIDANERSEKLQADLSRQLAAAGALSELEARIAATKDDLTRMSQARADAQAELSSTQKSLTAVRRELSEVDRSALRAGDMEASAIETTAAAADPAPAPVVNRGVVARGGWGRRGRMYRSFPVRGR